MFFLVGRRKATVQHGNVHAAAADGYDAITVHGFRSTFRNWAGEQTNYPFEVCEQALAHRLPDAVAAAYLRSDFFERRASLLADWSTYCKSKCQTSAAA